MLPEWMPLFVFVWAVAMVAYHALGLLFEWLDRKHWLNRFNGRRSNRRGYLQLPPLVLLDRCCVMLPYVVACQALGLAFVGNPHLGAVRICINLALLAIVTGTFRPDGIFAEPLAGTLDRLQIRRQGSCGAASYSGHWAYGA